VLTICVGLASEETNSTPKPVRISAGHVSTTNTIDNIFEAKMKNLLFILAFVGLPALGHGFAGFYKEKSDQNFFMYGVHEDCPVSEAQVESIIRKAAVEADLKVALPYEDEDFERGFFWFDVACYPASGLMNFHTWVMEVDWSWKQDDYWAEIDLADEFGSANAKGIEVKIGEKAGEAFKMYKAAISAER
jgi:hypothetical protein